MDKLTAEDAFTQLLHQAALAHNQGKEEFSEDAYRAFRSGAQWAKGVCLEACLKALMRMAQRQDAPASEPALDYAVKVFNAELEKIKNGSL